jgi:hypothetical protein
MKRKRKVITEMQRRREAKERAERALAATRRGYGIALSDGLKGITPDPLVTKGWVRRPKPAPTSDRIPGPAPSKDLIHAHKWKRGAEESEATVAAIRRKAAQIGPAYNKGALQYLPSAGIDAPRKRRD